ncbi:phosphocholine cytidylyltransferase family protein [bacterium]|nr:phosphocholine cytidylyltransferase family protein [bacterium]
MTTAIILAAGFGSRLMPLTKETPKCLLTVKGKTILECSLKHLEACGIKNVIIVTGFEDAKLQSYIKNYSSSLSITAVCNSIYNNTNNAYSLKLALDVSPGSFLLLDGDLVYDKKILENLLQNKGENILMVDGDHARLNAEAMKATIDNKQNITLLSKKTAINDSLGEYIGMLKLGATTSNSLKKILDQLTEEENKTYYYEDGINKLIKAASDSFSYQLTDGLAWSEIDTVDDLNEANR